MNTSSTQKTTTATAAGVQVSFAPDRASSSPSLLSSLGADDAANFVKVLQRADLQQFHDPLLAELEELLASYNEGALAAPAGADQRLHQPVGMVDPLGIARDLGAYRPRSVTVVARTADAPDGEIVELFYFQSTGGGAVMRTGAVVNCRRHGRSEVFRARARLSTSVSRKRPLEQCIDVVLSRLYQHIREWLHLSIS